MIEQPPGHVLLVRAAKRLKRRAKQRLELFDPLTILPYRTHGTRDRLRVSGRLVEKDGVIYGGDDAASTDDPTRSGNGTLQNLRDSIRRLRSDEIPGALLEVTSGSLRVETRTDEEGYFHVELELPEPVGPGWHAVGLRLLESIAGSVGIEATAHVLVPRPDADFGVISDIDDTIVRTGAADRLRMIATVMFNDARSREAFPGVARLYRALEAGPGGASANPIFYVSRSGWNLYDLMDAFFERHGIPRGPIFLTDLALLEPKSTALGGQETKGARIRMLIEAYPTLPFVLIGDSGQQDPEIYLDAVRRHPGRVRAVYVRDVTHGHRDQHVERILAEMRSAGVPALAVASSDEAFAHAASLGLIRGDGEPAEAGAT